jgi:hypothetical protein
MFDYGAQEQALGQKMLDYPMAQTQAFSKLLQGYQIPTGTVQQKTGPEAGAYSTSPLAQIASLLAGLGSFMRTPAGKSGGSVAHGRIGKPAPMSVTHRGKGVRMKVGGAVPRIGYQAE